MFPEIAITGIAGRFPGARNLREFHQVLRKGVDCIAPLSKSRILNATMPFPDLPYQQMGFLEEVDLFDHRFFNISMREAQHMDPHQRIMMEVTVECIESAALTLESFHRSRTGILVSNADYEYFQHFTHFEPTMFSGSTPFSIAGRLSRFLDTTGPAFMIDTGCSATHMAVDLACELLHAGTVPQMLVVGGRVLLNPPRTELSIDVGVNSSDGKTRSFSAQSVGSGSSEGFATLLLKPLPQAIADGDIIYAIIKSSAANSNAQTSGSLTATSAAAQAEVIRLAWEKAGLDPETITSIEAHGSGTKLGDPIEVSGIDQAYKGLTQKNHFVSLSCVKSNIGHTDKMAGMSGLVKTVLSLRNRELFPLLHFTEPNPFIDFKNSVTKVQTQFEPWNPECGVRRAGVSSFGFAGNNVHVILEEGPLQETKHGEFAVSESAKLFVLSSRRKDGVADAAKELLNWAEELSAEPKLSDMSRTLCAGRSHHRYRRAFTAATFGEWKEKLKSIAAQQQTVSTTPAEKIFFLFSDHSPVPEALLQQLMQENGPFRSRWTEVMSLSKKTEFAAVGAFAFSLSLHAALLDAGISSVNLLGTGTGDCAVKVITGQWSLAEAIAKCESLSPEPIDSLEARLLALAEREARDQAVAFVEMGSGGAMIKALKGLAPRHPDLQLSLHEMGEGTAAFNEWIGGMAEAGFAINWQQYSKQRAGQRIEMPAYVFEKIRCWISPPTPVEKYEAWLRKLAGQPLNEAAATLTSETSTEVFQVDESWTQTQQRIAAIWISVLRLSRVELDDDFFSVGGHSLFGTMVTNRIEKEFGIRLEFKDILTFSTIRLLARGVDMLLQNGGSSQARLRLTAAPAAPYYPLSHAQRRMWVLHHLEGASTLAYNLPMVVQLHGPLDRKALHHAFNSVVARHEGFRTSFHEVEGVPMQRVHESATFELTFAEADETKATALVNAFIRPFDLEQAPLMRALLIQLEPERHVLALDIHHIIFDGTSLPLLLQELNLFYAGGTAPAPALHYKDFAVWQQQFDQSKEGREQEEWWLSRFEHAPAVAEVPGDFARPVVKSYAGDRVTTAMGMELSLQLQQLAKETGTTVYMVILACYNFLIHRYTGSEDVVVGTPVAGRSQQEVETMPGFFVNTLAMRNYPKKGQPFYAFLDSVKAACLHAYKYQDYPVERLIEKLAIERDASRNPLFETMIALQNIDMGSGNDSLGALEIAPFGYKNPTTKFDLSFEFIPTADGLVLNLEYATALYKESTIRRITEDLFVVMRSAAENQMIKPEEIRFAGTETGNAAAAVDFDFNF